MATVAEVIERKLAKLHIDLDQTQLDELEVDFDLNMGAAYSKANATQVKKALLQLISDLLAMPDVTEGGFSLKYNREGVSAYLSSLREELGITIVQTATVPTVTDKSYLW